MMPNPTVASVSARCAFVEDDRCRFRPSTRAGVRVVCRLTARCPFLCGHCLASAAGARLSVDLPLQAWQEILQELPAIGGTKVLLTGGEPLLFEGLAELTATITALGVSTDLNSTLWLMTPQRARELADAGLTEASVAIEGPEPIHDQMHGQPGAFARLRAGVRMLQEVGVAVDGSLCVTPVNLGHVQRAIQQAAEWGLGSFTVSRMLPVGHGLNSAGPTVSEGELAELHASLAAARAGAEGIPVRCVGLLGAPHPEHCRQGVTLIGIRADGGLVPCVLTRCELPHLPRPQAVGLARAVGAMRAALERTEPVLCFGSPTAWSSP